MYAEFYIPQMQHTTGVTGEDVVLAAAGITIKYGVECNLSLSLSLSLSLQHCWFGMYGYLCA
jgi:hypothetical protein